jgi:hypothetical protein
VAGRSRRRFFAFKRFLGSVKLQRYTNIVPSIIFQLEFISFVCAWGLLCNVWELDLQLNRHVWVWVRIIPKPIGNHTIVQRKLYFQLGCNVCCPSKASFIHPIGFQPSHGNGDSAWKCSSHSNYTQRGCSERGCNRGCCIPLDLSSAAQTDGWRVLDYMTLASRPCRLQPHVMEVTLPIDTNTLYDLFIAAVHAHTFL